MTNARGQAVAAPLPDGDVLVDGGDQDGNALSSAELYDTANGTFTATGSMNIARFFADAAPLPDGDVLVDGGTTDTVTELSSAEIYDTLSGTFTQTASMTTARAGEGAAPLPNGEVLMAGGLSESTGPLLSSAEVFESAPEASVAGGDFGDQTVGQRRWRCR